MRIALIADAFPPMRSSTAVQLRDLSEEFVRQGHEVTVMVASPSQSEPWILDDWKGVRVLRLKTPKIKDIDYVRRTVGEFLMPFYMWSNLKKSPLGQENYDGVVWNAPSIFFGPLVKRLKNFSACPSYLIIRDIFPEWAVDMGLMGRGLPYRFFRAIADYQYSVADVIGVQTSGNEPYFGNWLRKSEGRLEVLQNWLTSPSLAGCSIDVSKTRLVGRKIFVYAGNMGVAQGTKIFVDMASELRDRSDIGFLFVGRGSDAEAIRIYSEGLGLDNVEFFSEIDPYEIPSLYAQCHVGLVALDPRHKTHNIPGKFLSYMHSGLPVLACVNDGNDLVDLIEKYDVGSVCVERDVHDLASRAIGLVRRIEGADLFSSRCVALANSLFSSEVAVKQIIGALNKS